MHNRGTRNTPRNLVEVNRGVKLSGNPQRLDGIRLIWMLPYMKAANHSRLGWYSEMTNENSYMARTSV